MKWKKIHSQYFECVAWTTAEACVNIRLLCSQNTTSCGTLINKSLCTAFFAFSFIKTGYIFFVSRSNERRTNLQMNEKKKQIAKKKLTRTRRRWKYIYALCNAIFMNNRLKLLLDIFYICSFLETYAIFRVIQFQFFLAIGKQHFQKTRNKKQKLYETKCITN